MSYEERGSGVRDEFLALADIMCDTRTMTRAQRDKLYALTGESEFLYGHAYLERVSDESMQALGTLREMLVALTYSSFSLDDDEAELSNASVAQIREIADQLRDVPLDDFVVFDVLDEDVLNINEIAESCLRLLDKGDVEGFNEAIKLIKAYGEQQNAATLEESIGLGNDDHETDDYERGVYDGDKQASEILEYYTTIYDRLIIHDPDHYHVDARRELLESIQ